MPSQAACVLFGVLLSFCVCGGALCFGCGPLSWHQPCQQRLCRHLGFISNGNTVKFSQLSTDQALRILGFLANHALLTADMLAWYKAGALPGTARGFLEGAAYIAVDADALSGGECMGALLLLHWVKIAFCVCWSVAVLAAAESKAAAVAVPNAPSTQNAAVAARAPADPFRDPFVSSVPGFVDFVPTAKDWDGMDDGMLDLEGACSC